MQKLLLLSVTIISFFSLVAHFETAHAAEFDIHVERVFTLQVDGSYQVQETQKVRNNSKDLLISKNNQLSFVVNIINSPDNLQKSLDTVQIRANNQLLAFTSEVADKSAQLKVNYPKEVRKGEELLFTLTYTNYGLVEQKGALWDIYAPGFVKDTSFEKGQIGFTYNTTVRVAQELPEANIILPAKYSTQTADGYRSYVFAQEDLIGNTVWIQLGKVQYYQFTLTQASNITDAVEFGFDNKYSLILPRDMEEGYISQKVYYTSIEPAPDRITADKDGNLIAVFTVPSNQNSVITVQGYAEVRIKDLIDVEASSTTFADLPTAIVSSNTTEAEYWEVTAPEIQSLAGELKGSETNVYQVVEDTYNHIVNTIDYSQIKRFGINERQGALATLRGGAAVCMEYSDLFLTLSRAQGIPARAVFGYSYDSRLDQDAQEAHQWVQLYMPGVENWISADVTWGESGPTMIGGTLNHFITHVASTDPNTPALVERTSYGGESALTPPTFEISALSALPETISTQTVAQLMDLYGATEEPSLLDSIEFQRNALALFFLSLAIVTFIISFSLLVKLARD